MNNKFTNDTSIFSSNPVITAFNRICSEAYTHYHENLSPEIVGKMNVRQHLLIRLLYYAETTSSSIFLLIQKGLTLQALALLRLRSEQVIVNSYLIHEEPEKALKPFVYHMSVKRYRNSKLAESDPKVKENLDPKFHSSNFKQQAVEAQVELDPTFDQESEKFQRGWTKLDLLSMAITRDKITETLDLISKRPLQIVYKGIYPLTSGIVHCDMSAISKDFLKIFYLEKEKPGVLMPVPSWAIITAGYCCMVDVIQTHETLKWLGYEDLNFYKELERKRIKVSEENNLA